MKSAALASLTLALLGAFTATSTLAEARERYDDDRYYSYRVQHDDARCYDRVREVERPRVVVVERVRSCEPPRIPYAVRCSHRGFVVSPYTGRELDVRGVASGSLCYDFSCYGRPYICP